MPGAGRLCACGCGRSLAGKRPEARYASDACRARAWKERTGYEGPSATRTRENGRRKPARRRSPRPGVSVYFRKRSQLAAVWAALLGFREEGDLGDPDLDAAVEAVQKALVRHRAKA